MLRTGDVVTTFDRTPYYAHRIIEKEADYAVTMGDNNDYPDASKLTRTSRLRLVTTARGPYGSVRQVACGDAGMQQFLRQQKKGSRRRFMQFLLRPFMPLKFLRFPARYETKFRDGTVQWSCAEFR